MRQLLPVERSARTRGLGPVCRYWDRCVALTWRKQSFSPARSEPVALQRLLTPGTGSKMTHPGTRGFKERCPQFHGAHTERGIRIPGEMLKIHSQWTRPPTSPPPRSEPGSVVQCRAGAFTFLNVPFSKCGVPSAPDAGEPVRGDGRRSGLARFDIEARPLRVHPHGWASRPCALCLVQAAQAPNTTVFAVSGFQMGSESGLSQT